MLIHTVNYSGYTHVPFQSIECSNTCAMFVKINNSLKIISWGKYRIMFIQNSWLFSDTDLFDAVDWRSKNFCATFCMSLQSSNEFHLQGRSYTIFITLFMPQETNFHQRTKILSLQIETPTWIQFYLCSLEWISNQKSYHFRKYIKVGFKKKNSAMNDMYVFLCGC